MLDSAAVLVALFVAVSATVYVVYAYAFPKKTGTKTGRVRAWSAMPLSGPRSARWMAANWRGAKGATPPHIYRREASRYDVCKILGFCDPLPLVCIWI